MASLTIPHQPLPATAQEFRAEIREFLSERLADFPEHARAQTWMGYDNDFSKAVAEKGWIGMSWPQDQGGGGRSNFDRYVLTEECIAAGAPVGAHWIGDRQSGPLILRVGTAEQKAELIPKIRLHKAVFCIGLSEPQAGSDLSAISSTAKEQADGSWLINGIKIWTTGADKSDYMIAVLRSDGTAEDRHRGLSQLLIPMRAKGVVVEPIETISGDKHFNQVTFDNVELPATALLGARGNGWGQAMSELAFERSGVERFLSCWPLFEQCIQHLIQDEQLALPAHHYQQIGEYVARVAALRRMSQGVAGMLERQQDPAVEAALVKEQGSLVEQDLPRIVQDILQLTPSASSNQLEVTKSLAFLIQNAPSFSLRGGTREILRGIVARGLGLR